MLIVVEFEAKSVYINHSIPVNTRNVVFHSFHSMLDRYYVQLLTHSISSFELLMQTLTRILPKIPSLSSLMKCIDISH